MKNMKRAREDSLGNENSKPSKQLKKTIPSPFQLDSVIVSHVFQFFKGKDLNCAKFVCSNWYRVQAAPEFQHSQCKSLKLPHNTIVEKRTPNQLIKQHCLLGTIVFEEKFTVKKDDNVVPVHSNHMRNGKKHGSCIKYANQKVQYNGNEMTCLLTVLQNFNLGKKHGLQRRAVSFPEATVILEYCEMVNGKIHGRHIEHCIEGGQYIKLRDFHYVNVRGFIMFFFLTKSFREKHQAYALLSIKV